MSKPSPVSELKGASEAMQGNLQQADRFLQELNNPHRPDEGLAKISIAQTYAICALVHAVRDLTSAVQAIRESE